MTTSPDKKVLGERNGFHDVDGGFRTLKLCRSPSKVSESREGVFSLSPSDPSKNFPVLRPEFLRYRPDWRSEVMTRMQDGEDRKEISGKINSGRYFCDEEGNNSHEETEDEVEEGEEEEEEEEGDVGRCDGRKGLIKKLIWFALFLLSVSHLYPVDISEVPAEAERINSYVGEVSSWPVHYLMHQAASKNISADMHSLTGEHGVLSGERKPDYDNEAILSKIEEEMLPNFGDDHRPLGFEELSGSLIWDFGFTDDGAGKDRLTGEHCVLSGESKLDCGNEVTLSKIGKEKWPNFGDDYQPLEFEEHNNSQENAAVVNEEEVRQSSGRGNELSKLEKLHPPTTLNLHIDLGKIMDEKLPSSEKHEIPEDHDPKKARFHRMVMLSLSIPFMIAATLLLGISVMRRSSPNTFPPQATEELYKGQPIVHSSSNAELQSLTAYPTLPRASADANSAFYPKHNPGPCVELLGEITFGEHNRSYESITVTELQLEEQSGGLISPEKKLVHKRLWESPSTDGSTFRKQESTPSHKCRSFHCNCSSGKSKICTDKGINGSSLATPTPLRRSSRIRNRVIQSP